MTSAAPARRRAQALKPGMMVADRYIVRGIIGQGGMGQVLDVEHVALGRHFALKVLRLERWSDELGRRFNREARALGSLTTPRVAQVTDFGIDSQAGPFYVMELLEGETLEDRLERDSKIPVQQALAICAELCEALADVHEAGIVHRDLKPSNIGLPSSGPVAVKLLDFGLAASVDDAFLSRITQSQQILGSLPYMAPEQFNAAEPAITMDIYATGIVLFECLTGRMPFIAPSTAAMIHQILSTPVPALPSDVSGTPLLQELLERLLAKEPEARFANAKAAAQAIREVAGGPSTAPPMTRVGLESVPVTGERASARHSVGNMATLVAESGMRLSGAPSAESALQLGTQPTAAMASQPIPSFEAAAPTPAPVAYPYPSEHPPPQPGSGMYAHPVSQLGQGALPPTSGTPRRLVQPQASPGMSWTVRIALAMAVGVVFAGMTAVAVAVGLSLIDDSIDSDHQRSDQAGAEPVVVPTATADSTPSVEETRAVVEETPTAETPLAEPPSVVDPTPVPATPVEAVREEPEPPHVRSGRGQAGRPTYERPRNTEPLHPPHVRTYSAPPPTRPPPTRPTPRRSNGVIREF